MTGPNDFPAQDPYGRAITVPVRVTADDHYALLTTNQQRDYFNANGYVVARNALPSNVCDGLRNLFSSLVKQYKGPLKRFNRKKSPTCLASTVT
jgi:hypothetical protein